MKLNELLPLHTLERFYIDELMRYKTPASKKARMTRDIRQHVSWLADVKEAVNRTGISRGHLHGEIFTKHHLRHYTHELAMLQRIADSIV